MNKQVAADQRRVDQELQRAQPHKTGAFVLGRRSLLRGVGGITVGLPFIEALSRKAQAAPGRPKRFLLWHQGQGTQFKQWAIPGSSPTDFSLGSILEPVAPFKDRMLFFRGIDNKVAEIASGDGHATKQSTCLTCVPNGGGPSFDQVLSARIRTPGQRSSLNLAVGRSAKIRLYAGPGDKIESQGDPRKVLASLFTTTPQSSKELERLALRRKSVLDGVKENMTTFRARLGTEDKRRLDQHTDKLRELETRLNAQGSVACTTPKLNLPAGFNPDSNHEANADAQTEILAMAFACNLTSVATVEFTDDHDPGVFGGFLSGYGNWHDMVHAGETKRDIGGLISGYRWYAARFAKMLSRFSEVQDESGTLLDHTTIQWTCDFGYGIGHNGLSVHAALAGSLGPDVKMGRLLSFSDAEKAWTASNCSLNNLYVTILAAFGQKDTTFGTQAKGVQPGPIAGVL
ncbi:MAG: DUF1552 domain-containing protein [Deltaproteobacteria bacterium]|nr:DUF1552 domain-containing protein [Deltaproteobacteria bacterium]